jgi:hypothetical protein
MREDQIIRLVGIVVMTVGYIARLVTVGNGDIGLFGYKIAPFALLLIGVIILALPETIEKIPFGPSTSK